MNHTPPAPKSLRLHTGIFGRANVGKSSFLNMIAGQDVAIASPVPGTTTDVVEKAMELLPLGPVLFLDTGGLDDASVLAAERVRKTRAAFDRSDIVVLVAEPSRWTSFEDDILAEADRRGVPALIVINKADLAAPADAVIARLAAVHHPHIVVSSIDVAAAEQYRAAFKRVLLDVCPESVLAAPSLIGDLVPAGGLVALIVPIDLEAPRGRLILPQVQTIRDALDNDAAAMVVKEREYAALLGRLTRPPDLAVCDSQVVLHMVADTPRDVPCTTFSIVFSRSRGDLVESARGAAAIHRLKPGDRVLIAEACSHHALEDDIGRVKIPRWLRAFCGFDVPCDVAAGHDYPADLSEYALVIHCGGCMINRRHMLTRIQRARAAGVPITNYGVCISLVQGVLPRVLAPFPAALAAYTAACARP